MEPLYIESQNWVTFPVAPLTSAPDQQKWVAVLSGIAAFELRGTGPNWRHEKLTLNLHEMVHAIFTMAHRTPSDGKELVFDTEHWANFATINSIAESSRAEQPGFGFAVDTVDVTLWDYDGKRCFTGLEISVAVANHDAQLLRVGFQSTLTGWIREVPTIL